MRRLAPMLALVFCGCTSFLGDGSDAADSADGSTSASDQGEGPACATPEPCGGDGTLGYAGAWASVDGAGFLRLYFSTPAASCGMTFQSFSPCATDCGNYSAYTLEVQVGPDLIGVYDLADLAAMDGDSAFNCSEGEAWEEGDVGDVGGGTLEITAVTDTCISGTFSGIAGDQSFTVPRC